MIRIKDVSFRYPGYSDPVLSNLDIQIKEGEYIGIIGPIGSGKSTLLRLVNGLLLPSKGDIYIDGMNTKESGAIYRIRQKVQILFQNPEIQLFGNDVIEDVAFGPANMGLSKEEVVERVDEALEIVGIRYLRHAPIHSLSLGQKQLTSLAGIISMRPKYLLLDEPTSFLDPASRKKIIALLRNFKQRGITILHVSHDLEELNHADRVIVLRNGRIDRYVKRQDLFQMEQYLEEIGMEVPLITRLLIRLREGGINISQDIGDLDTLCKELLYRLRRYD